MTCRLLGKPPRQLPLLLLKSAPTQMAIYLPRGGDRPLLLLKRPGMTLMQTCLRLAPARRQRRRTLIYRLLGKKVDRSEPDTTLMLTYRRLARVAVLLGVVQDSGTILMPI